MRLKLVVFLCLTSFNLFSQITFEKGYIINLDNQKIECLIKNEDWANNPDSFYCKFSENGEVVKKTISDVLEFGIENHTVYKKFEVDIDKSDNSLTLISYNRNPEFLKKELFLKYLVIGKANLYLHHNGNVSKFFYSLNKNESPKQLVYILFNSDGNIAYNKAYKQQLWNDLKCESIDIKEIENLKYDKQELVDFFIKYNTCTSSDYERYDNKIKRDFFDFSIKSGVDYNYLKVENGYEVPFDFEQSFSGRIGVEFEYIFPFNKNKWSFLFEPTYSYYKSKGIGISEGVSFDKKYNMEIDMQYVQLPISIRHYFFLTKKSQLFLNINYIPHLTLKSSKSTLKVDEFTQLNIGVSSVSTKGFGIGYRYRNKYSVEFRATLNENIFSKESLWLSDFRTVSFILGYKLF